MGASIFTVEQISIDGDGSVTEIQEEQFIGQREEILSGIPAHWNHALIQQLRCLRFMSCSVAMSLLICSLDAISSALGGADFLPWVWR